MSNTVGIIQHEGWSTSDRDPGYLCPKCNAGLIDVGDNTFFCEDSMDDRLAEPTCDFQYTLSEQEEEAELKKFYSQWDEEAKARTAKEVAKHGPPVFGQTNPDAYVLPSHREAHKDDWYKKSFS